MRRAVPLLNLSLRGLLLRRGRSLLTALSVAVAVTGLTVFLSLGAGLRRAVDAQVGSIRPQLQVSRSGPLQALAPPPNLSGEVLAQVEAQRVPLGLKHVTPVLLAGQDRAGLHLTLYGIPAAAGFGRVYPYARVARGRGLEARDEGAEVAVLGDRAARHLAAGVGDRVPLAGGTRARVVGILAPTGTLTDAFVVAPLRTLQRALRVPGLISLVAVEVGKEEDVPRVERVLLERVDAEVQTQQGFREVLARLLGSAEVLQRVLAGVALLVGFLSVLTTLTMTGHERRAELAGLRALGLRPLGAAGLIVFDGVLLAGAGGVAGSLAGGLLAGGLGVLTERGLGVRAAVMTPGVLLAVLLVGALIGLLAALPVAWAVGRQPIPEALRSA
ncbi:hypothetical protein DAETH_39190 (plasmid) [Deinococcus aetherius]|uniref:ABC transporter permease n=1 Tax=Deinococcus aetherius TaxID=200252 RepID=A0ABN6RMD6_9DEIO|nr:ABC transporter permease [Deinococcus aetherius]BDP43950.1 hypothetical protein DAETH_39190 [Deinococcus aetherius]